MGKTYVEAIPEWGWLRVRVVGKYICYDTSRHGYPGRAFTVAEVSAAAYIELARCPE